VASGQKHEFQGPAGKVAEAMLDTGLFNSAVTNELPDKGQGAGWLVVTPRQPQGELETSSAPAWRDLRWQLRNE